MMVERLTHRDIGTAVTELVIRPARLSDTYWPPAGERHIRGTHAHNYTVDEADPTGPLVDVTAFEPSWAGASGAMVSTPSDLDRFWQELLGGRLLPGWALAEMRTAVPAPDLGPDVEYGLGPARLPLTCGGYGWAHGGDLAGGGGANVSGRDGSGRAATVYITALTGGAAMTRLLHAFDLAFCAQPGSGHGHRDRGGVHGAAVGELQEQPVLAAVGERRLEGQLAVDQRHAQGLDRVQVGG